jgi:hypothetical protein
VVVLVVLVAVALGSGIVVVMVCHEMYHRVIYPYSGNVLDVKQLVLRIMSEHIFVSRCESIDVMRHWTNYELL